ncbi:MAG: hypothetical protein GF401_19050 [Chitinivibrionales bacterium]|nr:hypothetical protein [Chitinivibrionales bacterium]
MSYTYQDLKNKNLTELKDIAKDSSFKTKNVSGNSIKIGRNSLAFF